MAKWAPKRCSTSLVIAAAAAAAKSLQLCLTLCDPIDSSPPGFPVPGILQARTLEWVAMKVKSESEVAQSCPTLATPWTAAYKASLSMGFSRQKYWCHCACWIHIFLHSLQSLLYEGRIWIWCFFTIFFPASPCRIEHIAGTHDYLLNEWMDGWTNPRKAECELSIVLICVLQRNIIR